jgi:hypothetical protein
VHFITSPSGVMNERIYSREDETVKRFLNILNLLWSYMMQSLKLILGYFGKKVETAQKGYKEFVERLAKEKYDSPLDHVVSSTLLGSSDFVEFIEEKYLSDMKNDPDSAAI